MDTPNISNVGSILDVVFSDSPVPSSIFGAVSHPGSGTFIANLTSATAHILTASLTQASRAAYRRSWDLFLNYKPVTNLPLQVSDVCNFIGHLFQSNLSASTISSHISALGYVHKLFNLPDPSQAFVVKKLLRGCHKLAGTVDSRLPITKDILAKLIAALSHTVAAKANCILLDALFKLCFHAFLRLGEVVSKSAGSSSLVVQRSNVAFQFEGSLLKSVQIVLHHFKNQKHNNPFVITLVSSIDPTMCPVAALHRYLSHFKHSSGPLFQFIGENPVTYSYVSTQLYAAATFAGLNPKLYKGHSFRIGGATYATSLGYSENLIKQLGRWNSNAFRRYIRIPAFNL
ncbi:uncharacterized protein LOC125674031 [Ostrea edulis]|uniref:uncharacterized protein LOC125674031 n=1 Tax=Ostrea edulis TaxID=37623 RepID=UPI0024AFC2A5|nr:uncharacterized protein LOC125674031 [Ostrea edulis]XP_056005452.1 uncharacterized protein LOC125674031 [Ostrea edulis]